LPPSFSHGVRSPFVLHRPRPFQPAFGSSMRPSKPLAKKLSGYGMRSMTICPSLSATKPSLRLAVEIGIVLAKAHRVVLVHPGVVARLGRPVLEALEARARVLVVCEA